MFIELLQSAGNRYLRLDPQVLQSLRELSGKVIRVNLTGFGKPLYLLPGEKGIELNDAWVDEPDVTLSGSILAFAQLGLREANEDVLPASDLIIEGDVELGQRFRQIVEHIDIDWEEVLSRSVGDITAHQIGNLYRNLRDLGRNVRDTAERNLCEYLQEEARLLAPESRVEQFVSAVDELRSATERLEQRVKRLLSAAS